MDLGLLYGVHPAVLTLGFVALGGGALELGYWLGATERRRGAAAAKEGAGPIEGSIYALFGLLLAFSFSFAVARADTRRSLVVEEANDVGTAYLRCDLAPEPERTALKRLLRDYLDARVEYSVAGFEPVRIEAALDRSTRLQADLWRTVTELQRREPANEGYGLLLAALNATFDIQTTRLAAFRLHLPDSVILMLAATAALTAATAGYATGLKRSRHVPAWLIFLALLGLVVNVILDLDRERSGLFRPPARALLDLQRSLQEVH